MSNEIGQAGMVGGRFGIIPPQKLETQLNRLSGVADVSEAERAEWEKQHELNKAHESAAASLQRIIQALDTARRETPNPLLKSDLDNSAKHCAEVAKQIRNVKRLLFPPPPPKETTPPEPQNEQLATPAAPLVS